MDLRMKKHPQADSLASRLTQAVNTPVASVVPFNAPQPVEPEPEAEGSPQNETDPPVTNVAAIEPAKPRRRRRAQTELNEADDTVPISLRPHRKLLTRYVAAAAARMLETGRPISAQQIMLEVLERGP
jgi:hypothetical protein